jgi:hypothetical protein
LLTGGGSRRDLWLLLHASNSEKDVQSIFAELGKGYMRRAYRMDENSFWKLYELLEGQMKEIAAMMARKKRQCKKKKCRRKQKRVSEKKGAVNGVIALSLWLSAAICYFVGGDPYDITLSHGMSHTEIYNSMWIVVEAVNRCDHLSFSFPKDHEEQRWITAGFMAKSKANFNLYCGCINGMLLWLNKPSESDCDTADVGSGKFFCGWKKKYGLCLQGVCDMERRFLDVCVAHPAATSNYLAFCTSNLKHKLEKPNFLAEGLLLVRHLTDM